MLTPGWNKREFFEFAASADVASALADGADPDAGTEGRRSTMRPSTAAVGWRGCSLMPGPGSGPTGSH